MQLENKVAIVTGAGHGIGRAISAVFAREGADIAAVDINESDAQATSQEVKKLGRKCEVMKVDIGDLTEIDRMVDSVLDSFGRIDILVNNAGVTRDIQFLDITESDWDIMYRVNSKGLFFCTQRVAKEMIKQGQGGRIINIASLAAVGHTGTSNVAYAGSKGAVVSMSRITGYQLAKYDITVNSICPGPTRTGMTDYSTSESIVGTRAKDLGITEKEFDDRRGEHIPIGRVNDPEDLANMALFVAGQGARNITSKTFAVDGGWTLM